MVQVQVREGLLEGEMMENEFGGSFYSFKGIPYAEPPLGDLRFKFPIFRQCCNHHDHGMTVELQAPQPKQPWDGVRSAKEHGPFCSQANPLVNRNKGIEGSEDCLYLNVYTPELKPTKPLPVMFLIHGGGFIFGRGDSDTYGPDFLVKEGVILVTTNYRLEILGFLCLDTEDVPGNAGMKDQVAALRWVKDNIANFGGDPNNVTIFGGSAGGASVTYHMISPMSKGLFKRAIAQSGAATNPWAKSFAPRERARILARKLGFNSDDDNELYKFFKTQPVEKLTAANVAVTLAEESMERDGPQYNIVAEKKFDNIEGFLYEDPYDALRNNGIHGGIDFMAGYNLDEGLMQMAYPADISKVIDQANKFHEVFVPKNIALNCKMSDQFEVGRRLKKFYFGNEEVTKENLGQLIKYYGTDWFVYGIVQFHKFSAKNANSLYFYKFSCCSERNIYKYILNVQHLVGDKPVVSHADDKPYLFPISIDDSKIDQQSETYKLIDNVVKLWTNFAKYGNPTPNEALGVTWEQYSPQQQKYLDIGNKLVPGIAPDAEEISLWEDIYKQYLPECVADV